MINLFCDDCKDIQSSQLQLRTEGESITIECLNCGTMRRLKNEVPRQ